MLNVEFKISATVYWTATELRGSWSNFYLTSVLNASERDRVEHKIFCDKMTVSKTGTISKSLQSKKKITVDQP